MADEMKILITSVFFGFVLVKSFASSFGIVTFDDDFVDQTSEITFSELKEKVIKEKRNYLYSGNYNEWVLVCIELNAHNLELGEGDYLIGLVPLFHKINSKRIKIDKIFKVKKGSSVWGPLFGPQILEI
ncbi:MAG: hypothetical protein MI748_02390, partial [Opitutales bacterium]|nr:hypothetical protein [Opitutales bacterium]